MVSWVIQNSWNKIEWLWRSPVEQPLPAKVQERLDTVNRIVAQSFSYAQEALVLLGAAVYGLLLPPFTLAGFIAHHLLPKEIDDTLDGLSRLFHFKSLADWGAWVRVCTTGVFCFLHLSSTLAFGAFVSGVKLHRACTQVGAFFNWR